MGWRQELWEIHEKAAKDWTPGSGEDIAYLSIGLVGEVGEAHNDWKKWLRGDHDGDPRAAILEELGDALAYASLLASASWPSIQDRDSGLMTTPPKRTPVPDGMVHDQLRLAMPMAAKVAAEIEVFAAGGRSSTRLSDAQRRREVLTKAQRCGHWLSTAMWAVGARDACAYMADRVVPKARRRFAPPTAGVP